MKLMQVFYFKNINNFFVKYKIIFYIMPMFFSIIFLIFYKPKNQNIHNVKNEDIYKKLKDIKKIRIKPKILNVLKDVEYQVKNSKLKITNTSLGSNDIKLELLGKFTNIMSFIYSVDRNNSYIKITNLEMSYDNVKKNNKLIIKIVLNKSYQQKSKENIDINKIANVFSNLKTDDEKKLFAIIGEFALIGSVWLKQGEQYKGETLTFIGEDFVTMNIDNNTYNLRILKDELVK